MAVDLTRLNAAVSENTTAVNTLIAKVDQLSTPDTTTQTAVDAAAAAVEASNTAIATELAKVNPPPATS